MYIYQDKHTLLHKLHPLTLILYIVIVSVLSLIFSHPGFLLFMFIGLLSVIIAADIVKEWFGYFKISLAFIVIIIIVNSIVVQAGSTVLLWGPVIPGLGKIRITLEAIFFALTMGLRLMVIITAFCLLTYVLNPDRGLQMLGAAGKHTALVLTLTVRLFPLLVSDFRRIYDVQRTRGVKFNGRLKENIRNFFPVINAVLLSSLERSFQLAEALHSRGFGAGKRTHLQTDFFRPRDIIIISVTMVLVVTGIFLFMEGHASFVFYPRLQPIQSQDMMLAAGYGILISVPAVLHWGWTKFRLFQSKM